MDEKNWKIFFEIIKVSLSIANEQEFNDWRINKLNKLLTHDLMICSSGDFNQNNLNHDIASHGNKQKVVDATSSRILNQVMIKLYKTWEMNSSRWFMLDYLDENFPDNSIFNIPELQKYNGKSMVVYGVRDIGNVTASLYVFFSKSTKFDIEHYSMGMLMPYLDSALRRIKSIQPIKEVLSLPLLSPREFQIMEWVDNGKTNYEIGKILHISPNTVKNHLKKIYLKLNVTSRAQAISILVRKPYSINY